VRRIYERFTAEKPNQDADWKGAGVAARLPAFLGSTDVFVSVEDGIGGLASKGKLTKLKEKR
jgi:hypothetical protein